MKRYQIEADLLARQVIDAVYFSDARSVRAEVSARLQLVLEEVFEAGVAQGKETFAQLRAEVERLEYAALRESKILGGDENYRLWGMIDLAARVAEQVAGEDLREIWWARDTRGIVVVSAAQKDYAFGDWVGLADKTLGARLFEDAELWVVLVSPGDMLRLRAGELELPDRFASLGKHGVALEKLYPSAPGGSGHFEDPDDEGSRY